MKELLSATVGVPLTLLVALMLFSIDARQVTAARRSPALVIAGLIGVVAVVVLVVVRFSEYA